MKRIVCLACLPMLLGLTKSVVIAGLITPTYSFTFTDAVTGDNEFIDKDGNHRWFVDNATDPDGLADSYGNDFYERPTLDTFDAQVEAKNTVNSTRSADVTLGKKYSAAEEYLGYVDIKSTMFGFDNQFMYFKMTLFTGAKITKDGTPDFGEFGSGTLYGVRISEDSNGKNGHLLRADGQANFGSTYQSDKTIGFFDKDSDMGGAGGITTTNENPGSMTGFENDVILSDGKLKADDTKQVLFSRIDKTLAMPIVEIAFDYSTYNAFSGNTINPNSLSYLVFEANRGYKDNSVYLWNDKNTFAEAGSPYNGIGYNNVDELDTLTVQLGVTPEPSTYLLFAVGILAIVGMGYRQRKKAA